MQNQCPKGKGKGGKAKGKEKGGKGKAQCHKAHQHKVVKKSGGGGHKDGGRNKLEQRVPGQVVLEPSRGQQNHNNNHSSSTHSN
eukprot:959670-Amphidinium_carterae.1